MISPCMRRVAAFPGLLNVLWSCASTQPCCRPFDDGDLDADEEALRGSDHEDDVPVGVNDRAVAPTVGYLKERPDRRNGDKGVKVLLVTQRNVPKGSGLLGMVS